MDRRKVVITGASGFLARAVVPALASHDKFEPIAVSRHPCQFPFEVHCQQVSCYSETVLPAGADLVHLAETAALDQIDREDADASSRVLETLLGRLAGFAVYASSVAVYGDQTNVPHRSDEILPETGGYAAAKRRNEELVIAQGGAVLRFANLYGPESSTGTVVDDIISQLGQPGPVRIRNGTAVRDFLWVGDAADAIAASLESKQPGVFNVASGKSVSIDDLTMTALEAAGEAGREVEQMAASDRSSEIHINIDETARLLGWRPGTSLETGLGKLIEEWRVSAT